MLPGKPHRSMPGRTGRICMGNAASQTLFWPHKVGRRHEEERDSLKEQREFHAGSRRMEEHDEEQSQHPAQVKPAFPRGRSGSRREAGRERFPFPVRRTARSASVSKGRFHSGKSIRTVFCRTALPPSGPHGGAPLSPFPPGKRRGTGHSRQTRHPDIF